MKNNIILVCKLCFVFQLISQSAALKPECLVMDAQKVPTADIGEESLTNFYQLVESGFNDTRVLNFTTCIDKNDDTLTGVQLTLWSEEYQVPLSLDPIGYLDSNCRTLTLDGGGIDSINASFS